jgi:competence protein ComEC
MELINSTNPHWIRCVKPHPAKKARMFDGIQTMNQLESSGVLGTLLLGTRDRWPRNRLLLVAMTGLTLWLCGSVADRLLERRWLRVDILDVGHGDSILVRTPSGNAFLVDGGTQAAGRSRVIPFLRHEGLRTLDAVVVTHPDEDHLGGVLPVIQQVRVKRLLTNGAVDDTMTFRALQDAVRRRGIPHETVQAGMSLDGPSGVHIEVLHPPCGFVPGTVGSSNDNSVVLKLTNGLVSILLTGDLEEEGLPWLLASGESLRATVLKVPHHGSRLGDAGAQFFEVVHPRVAIVSVGRLHQLPAQETIEALRRVGARLYSTREHGAVSLRTNGRRLEVRSRGVVDWIRVE